jgi:hypothetical protein
MLSQQAISEFREIFFREYGQTLTDEEATEKANSLLNFYKVIFQTSNMKRNMNHERTNRKK